MAGMAAAPVFKQMQTAIEPSASALATFIVRIDHTYNNRSTYKRPFLLGQPLCPPPTDLSQQTRPEARWTHSRCAFVLFNLQGDGEASVQKALAAIATRAPRLAALTAGLAGNQLHLAHSKAILWALRLLAL